MEGNKKTPEATRRHPTTRRDTASLLHTDKFSPLFSCSAYQLKCNCISLLTLGNETSNFPWARATRTEEDTSTRQRKKFPVFIADSERSQEADYFSSDKLFLNPSTFCVKNR